MVFYIVSHKSPGLSGRNLDYSFIQNSLLVRCLRLFLDGLCTLGLLSLVCAKYDLLTFRVHFVKENC